MQGESFSDFSQPARAREVFQQFETEFPDSPLRAEEKLAVARTYEREQNWPEATACYENWLKEFPAGEQLPHAEYARAWATFQAGDETDAFALFSAYVTRFPTNELAPLRDQFCRCGKIFGGGNQL